ncbi:MAG: beta-lactamase family protein [Candidatus Heimdallarchaeota archaeon]|nr:beta-lactamase family protein [Candidatus Heimdallarchaeota archaeon]
MSDKELVKQALHLIDNWIDYQVYIKQIPGVSIGVYFEDEPILRKEYGYAHETNNERLNANHMFRIASHSKLFTATAIMKLYDQGKLSIDDKISKHLPWFNSKDDKNLDQIRIFHLLTHSSGITRDGETGHWIKFEFPGKDEITKQVTEGISFFKTAEKLKYSNFGYTLLGQVIEAVSGQNFEEYIKNEILDPLDMKDTVVDVYDSNENRHATGHKRKLPNHKREIFQHVNAGIMHSATGLSSTADDLIKFYKAHIFGNDILFPDYIKREMQRTQFTQNGENRGFGFGVAKFGGLEFVGHGGGYPGFITRSGLNQKHKMIIVALTNAVDGPALTLAMGIGKLIDYVLKNKMKFKTEDKKIEVDFNDIIGFYASDWGTSLYSQISDKLVSISPSLDNPLEFLQIYEQQDDLNFKVPDKPMFDSPGQTFSFIDDQDGEKAIKSAGAEIKRFHYSY